MAFDNMPNFRFLEKQEVYVIDGSLLGWNSSFLMTRA